MKRLFAVFVCFCCIAFLVFSPVFIAGGVHRDIYSIKDEKEAGKYRGFLTLWHVVSFKTSRDSGGSFLASRAESFERSNPFVYIDVVGMTEEEAKLRMANGEKPDLISYPSGFLADRADLVSLPDDERIEDVFSKCGMFGSARVSYPYYADAYAAVLSDSLIEDSAMPLPFGTVMDMEHLGLYVSAFPGCPVVLSGTEPKAALKSPLSEKSDEYIGDGIDFSLGGASFSSDLRLFTDGKTPYLICPYGDFTKLAENNPKLSLSAYAISRYTDLIQLIGAYDSGNDAKNAMCSAFCRLLLNAASKKKLEKCGVLPAAGRLDGDGDAYYSMFAYIYENGIAADTP